MTRFRAVPRLLLWSLGLLLIPLGLHLGLHALATPTPPALARPKNVAVEHQGSVRRFGQSQSFQGDSLIVARLNGTPEERGTAHTRLLYDAMLETERRLSSRFQQYVPHALSRWLLTELAQARFFDIDQGMTLEHRREIAAMAEVFAPDPFASLFPTYQRLIYLNSLYDISLSFEESPLLGCTTFFVAGAGAEQHTLFARNFDFEVDPVFDENKALFVVREPGKIPYISISWPGLIGSVSGVNRSGLVMVVHGGRAGSLARRGQPVLHITRDVLGKAENVAQAYDELVKRPIMVSHIVVMADAAGNAEVVERVPDRPPYRYRLDKRAVVTNHLVGPAADDPKNQRIRARTSTLARQQRGLQLLASRPKRVTAGDLIAFLRDRQGVNGTPLPLGDRRAIGALIAAHGFVLDLTAKRIWVGGKPTLLGPYMGLGLDELFDEQLPLDEILERAPRIAADPLLGTEEYASHLRTHPR